jgi:hypothetical protein
LGLREDAAHDIAKGLARVYPTPGREDQFDEAARLILCELWDSLGEATCDRDLAPILEGTWAGGVLERMRKHEAARQAARRAQAEMMVRVQRRREEKKRLRQEQHLRRQAAKAERERPWREKQRNGDS